MSKYAVKQVSITYKLEGKPKIETLCESEQILSYLTNKALKICLKNEKKIMIKEVKEGLVKMLPQIKNINENMEIILKEPNGNSEKLKIQKQILKIS